MGESERENPQANLMRIEILDKAEDDLVEGFQFYESQHLGLGAYFLDSLYWDIDSLSLHAGIYRVVTLLSRMPQLHRSARDSKLASVLASVRFLNVKVQEIKDR